MAEEKVKKRGGCLKWFVIIIGVLILFSACAAIFSGGEDTTDTSSESGSADSTTEQAAEESAEESTEETAEEVTEESTEEVVEEEEAAEVVGVGETLTVDDIDFTVNEWYQQDSVGDVMSSTANDTYLILDVSVTNNKNEAVMLMNDFFKIVIGETTYEPDGPASTTANQAISPDNLGLLGEELNPGSSRNALIVYDVTQEVVDNPEKQLQVQSGMFGTQTGVINLQ